MSNPYSKLEEALRLYLNPTLDLILQDVDLSKHCYYLIKKYPPHEHGVWTMIIQKSWDVIDELEIDDTLKHNLLLARDKKDDHYLDYLQCHRPRRKLTLKLVRSQPIISNEVANALHIDDPGSLTTLKLKRCLNSYILEQRLQEKSQIILDEILKDLLKLDKEDKTEKMHFYEVHRLYNLKYLTS